MSWHVGGLAIEGPAAADPVAFLTALAKHSKQGRVVAFLAEGASDAYGNTVFTGGKNVRVWRTQEGETVMESGSPLSVEEALASDCDETGDGEGRILGPIEGLTGVALDALAAVEFTVVV